MRNFRVKYLLDLVSTAEIEYMFIGEPAHKEFKIGSPIYCILSNQVGMEFIKQRPPWQAPFNVDKNTHFC